jgi:hypothetical protein
LIPIRQRGQARIYFTDCFIAQIARRLRLAGGSGRSKLELESMETHLEKLELAW